MPKPSTKAPLYALLVIVLTTLGAFVGTRIGVAYHPDAPGIGGIIGFAAGALVGALIIAFQNRRGGSG
jgi:hypothetical protein